MCRDARGRISKTKCKTRAAKALEKFLSPSWAKSKELKNKTAQSVGVKRAFLCVLTDYYLRVLLMWNLIFVPTGLTTRVPQHNSRTLCIIWTRPSPWVENRAFPWRVGGGKFCLRFSIPCAFCPSGLPPFQHRRICLVCRYTRFRFQFYTLSPRTVQ